MDLKNIIRDVPDFPKPGIGFKDITTLLSDPAAFKYIIDNMKQRYSDRKVDVIIGAESRGFIFGAPLAYQLNTAFVPVRKPGKLPYKTISESFELEYGTDSFEIHTDAIKPGDNVLIVDDLLATGGTAEAITKLVEQLEGNIIGLEFIIELTFLNGREKLKNYKVNTMVTYDSE